MKLQIATGPVDGYYVSPAHADRGDGVGERSYVYVGRYHCASDYLSKTNVLPKSGITRATARTNIHNLGTNVWQLDFALWWTVNMLYLVEFANWNSQAMIGYGCGNGSSKENNGASDTMPYHTGTMKSNRTTYGVGIQYRYIEDLWANVYQMIDGIYFSGTSIYCIKDPNSFSDSSGGTLVGTRGTSTGYISKLTNPTVTGFEYALYPSEVNGSASTYMCDYYNYSSSGVIVTAGAFYSQTQYNGVLYLDGTVGSSGAYAHVGSRLMVLPSSRLN